MELSKGAALKRENAAYMALKPLRMRFKNLDGIEDEALHLHVANLLDIFVRMRIQEAGGDLKTTKYWLQ